MEDTYWASHKDQLPVGLLKKISVFRVTNVQAGLRLYMDNYFIFFWGGGGGRGWGMFSFLYSCFLEEIEKSSNLAKG